MYSIRSKQNSGANMDPSTLVLSYTEGEKEYELLDDSQFLYPFPTKPHISINFKIVHKWEESSLLPISR